MRFFRKRDFKVIGKGKDLRENDVREIKGEGNFKKGVIIVKKKVIKGLCLWYLVVRMFYLVDSTKLVIWRVKK